MPAISPGTRVLATDLHGFTPLEVESVTGGDVTVLIDPRVGVRNERSTLPRSAISHVLIGGTWEYQGTD